MALRGYLVDEVTQDYADGLLTRRDALHRLGLLGIGVVGASALLAACDSDGGGGAADTSTPPSGPGATGPSPGATGTPTPGASPPGEPVRFDGPSGELQAAWAGAAQPRGAVLVIHENRGLTPHFYDLVGRFARDGYSALCVDLLSAEGGTASLSDPAAAPAALADAPAERLLADLGAGIDELQRRVPSAAVGAIGFCFGGGMTWNLLQAGEQRLAAAAPFYGPSPENPDFGGARAAVYAVYAGNDARVNATRERAGAALAAAGLTYEIRTFAGAEHAFFNDTGPRYDEAAAREAYAAVLDWFAQHLR